MTTRTLIKSSLHHSPSGKRVADISDEIGQSYSNTYQNLQGMIESGEVYKVMRGVYALTRIPEFTTSECISLLQSLELQEEEVRIAQEELDRAESQLQATKRTIRQTMMTAFED